MNPLEGSLDAIGLMRGDMAPLKRFLFGTAVAYGVVIAIQPQSMFIQGQARPWSLTSPEAEATNTPHWLIPVTVGAALALFI
jgi:hypothetical protein